MGEIYITYEYWVAAFQLGLAMLGMGATLTVGDFKDVMREPKPFSFGMLIQLILVPLIAYVFIITTGIIGGVAVGIALIAAIPGGTTSNIFTYMAKGNVPLSISITGVTTLACLVSTPLVLSLLITDFLPSDFRMPTSQIITDITFTLLLPLAIGMLILRALPAQAPWISKWAIRASLFGILIIVVGSLMAGRLDLNAFGVRNIVLVLVFVIVLIIASWCASRLLGLNKTDSTAIEMEVVVRNINLGLIIKVSMFPAIVGVVDPIGNMVLFTILLYGAIQLIMAAVIIAIRRHGI